MSASVATPSVAHDALQNLVKSLSPEQLSKFTEALSASRSPKAYAPEAPAMFDLNHNTSNRSKLKTKEARLEKAIHAKERQIEKDCSKKRPLNSFIAFRSYYSPLLGGLTQKVKSGLIKDMWATETRQHFFSLLAKAYSKVRDSYGAVKLDRFLSGTVGLLPIIPAEQYLATMGWEQRVTADGQVMMFNVGNGILDNRTSLTTNMSVQDIVEHCYSTGLVPRPAKRQRVQNHHTATAMSFAAAPASRTASTYQQLDPEIVQYLTVGNTNTESGMEAVSAGMSAGSSPGIFDFDDMRTDYNPTIEQVTADQQQAFEQHPFALHFHPEISPPVLGFEPHMIQDEFDPFSFELSDYVNFELK